MFSFYSLLYTVWTCLVSTKYKEFYTPVSYNWKENDVTEIERNIELFLFFFFFFYDYLLLKNI